MSMTINETIVLAANEVLEIDLYRIDWAAGSNLRSWDSVRFTAAEIAEALHLPPCGGVLTFDEDSVEAFLEGWLAERNGGVKAEGFRWQWDVCPMSAVAVA